MKRKTSPKIDLKPQPDSSEVGKSKETTISLSQPKDAELQTLPTKKRTYCKNLESFPIDTENTTTEFMHSKD